MMNFPDHVWATAMRYDLSPRRLEQLAEAHLAYPGGVLPDEVDDLPWSGEERVDGLLAIIEKSGTTEGFLADLDCEAPVHR